MARTAASVAEQGVSAPRVWGVVNEGDRHGIVMDRIEGHTLFDALMTEPERVDEFGEQLAALHLGIHRCSLEGLDSRNDHVRRQIGRAPGIDLEIQGRAIARVIDHDDHILCHGDLHPGNVMIDADGSMLAIDWDFAMSGPPGYDVARAWLLLDRWALAPGTYDADLIGRLRKPLAAAYRRAYLSLSTLTDTDLDLWLLPASVARLCEPIPEEAELVRADVARFASATPV